MESLVLRIRRGESALMPKLWQRVEGLIAWFAMRFYAILSAPQCDLDDLKQSGYLALVKAVERYRPDSEAKFATVLALWLRNEFAVAAGLRRSRDAFLRVGRRLDDPVGDDTDTVLGDLIEDPTAMDAFADAERRVFNEQLHAALENVLSQLDDDDADVIRKRYFDGLRPAEIGDERQIIKRESKALRKCRAPALTKDLRQFLDDAMPSRMSGLRPTEQAVILREDLMRPRFQKKWL